MRTHHRDYPCPVVTVVRTSDTVGRAEHRHFSSSNQIAAAMIVYVTKNVLSAGIQERTVMERDGNFIKVKPFPNEINIAQYYWKPHWHETREAAILHAEEHRKKRIVALKKQIAKLEAMTFE